MKDSACGQHTMKYCLQSETEASMSILMKKMKERLTEFLLPGAAGSTKKGE